MVTFWLIALVVFLVVEGATVNLVSIWFAIGALAALISAICQAPLWMQVFWFVVISAVSVAVTRPLAKKYLTPRHRPTNADRFIGMAGFVTERIDNLGETGSAQVGGRIWSARSESGAVIEAGEKVRSVRIEGVKLIVAPMDSMESAMAEKE